MWPGCRGSERSSSCFFRRQRRRQGDRTFATERSAPPWPPYQAGARKRSIAEHRCPSCPSLAC
eukprot:1327575-Pleurochrysis_carterae.AAC.1